MLVSRDDVTLITASRILPMEVFFVLVILYLMAALIICPIWVWMKLRRQDETNAAIRSRLDEQLGLIQRLQAELAERRPVRPPELVAPAEPSTKHEGFGDRAVIHPSDLAPARGEAAGSRTPVSDVPPLLAVGARHASAPELSVPQVPQPVLPMASESPNTKVASTPQESPHPPATAAINWEQFMGAKLFAWLGGLALFLGVAFFVKYSFERDLIPAEVRVSLGFLLGLGLIIGGMRISRERYAITAQTLVSTGIVSLYAVTFACHAVYHFRFFGTVPTFLLMAVITAAAFLLAARFQSRLVALLGILGGFLTPILLSTGVDNPGGLFGYLAMLVVGLATVALRQRWFYLVPLGAAGVVFMLLGWAHAHYVPAKLIVAITVCLGFNLLYQGIVYVARRWRRDDMLVLATAVVFPVVSFSFAGFFMMERSTAVPPDRLFEFILATDLLLLALIWKDARLKQLTGLAGLVVFLLLALWITSHLNDLLLFWALGAALVFAGIHTAFPLVLERRYPSQGLSWTSQVMPPLGLMLMLIPLIKLPAVSLFLWPAILLVNVIAIALAAMSASLVVVAVVLVLTVLATGVSIYRLPTSLAVPESLFLIIGFFALFFVAASGWLVRRFSQRDGQPGGSGWARGVMGSSHTQLPAFSALLPFVLVVMVSVRLYLPNPSAVFGLGLLLSVLTLGLAWVLRLAWLPLLGLIGVALVEYTWKARSFPGDSLIPLYWYLGFYVLFSVYPFLFRKRFSAMTGPWAVAALAGLAQFPLVYDTLQLRWPVELKGVIPALFAIAPLVSLMAILKGETMSKEKRLNQLAWFGGIALLFLTWILPIQLDRQWLTVAFALEGIALLRLFHRVPHPGLRATGVVLLCIAFIRLALNPAVLSYYPRGTQALLNWYLYAYGISIVALFIAARWVVIPARSDQPEQSRVFGINGVALFNTLGVILSFLLLNIEIAHYFAVPGSYALTFQFSGSFARDMTYTIGWALFAFGLLVVGIWKRARAARFAAIALLSVALLKLFLNDLARLEALYRVAAFVVVAIIAILASFAYQRFLPSQGRGRS